MAANYSDIKSWFEDGVSQKNKTHMIIVCDTFDYDDYPVYVSEDENVHEIQNEYDNKDMQKVMEVYNLSKDMEQQLSMTRCFCY